MYAQMEKYQTTHSSYMVDYVRLCISLSFKEKGRETKAGSFLVRWETGHPVSLEKSHVPHLFDTLFTSMKPLNSKFL